MHILFAGGGTAGHVNPALAVAGHLKIHDPAAVISFIGNQSGMELGLVTEAGFDFYGITVHGFQRKLTIKNIGRNVSAAYRVLTATGEAKRLLRKLAPDVVVGTGGYVSGPVLRAAAKMGIPTAIHEQNAFPGVTTKMLAPLVDRVMLTMGEAETYIKSKNPVVLTGLPVRGSILAARRDAARKALSVPDDALMALSTGGSLGARAINTAMAAVIAAHTGRPDVHHIHAYGRYGAFMPALLREQGVDLDAKNLRITEYINDMELCLAAADVVVGRSVCFVLRLCKPKAPA